MPLTARFGEANTLTPQCGTYGSRGYSLAELEARAAERQHTLAVTQSDTSSGKRSTTKYEKASKSVKASDTDRAKQKARDKGVSVIECLPTVDKNYYFCPDLGRVVHTP